MSNRIVVTHYTDPWSVWCWAAEPQLLRLRHRHGGLVDFQVRVGAIHESPVGPDFPREDIRRMFGAARRASGMPVDVDVVMKPWPGTTHRAGIAAKAAGLVEPSLAAPYLRLLRQTALVRGRNIEDLDVQEDVARAVGIDPKALDEAIESEEAKREFYADQAEARLRGVTGFPTVTFRNASGLEVGVGGFQPTEAYEAALARVAGGPVVEAPCPEVADLLKVEGPLFTAELAEVCDELEDAMTLRLMDLERAGQVRHEAVIGALRWSLVA